MTLHLGTLFMLGLALKSLAMEPSPKDLCNFCNPSGTEIKSHSLSDVLGNEDDDAERCTPLAIDIENYSLDDFPCDKAYDAERGTLCTLCTEVLGVGSHIGKIESDPPLYFHYRCLEKSHNICVICSKKLNTKITWKNRIQYLKKSSSKCFCTSFKCLAATAGTVLSLYVVYYFSMGPGSAHYCPCLNSESIDNCKEEYPGCNFNLF